MNFVFLQTRTAGALRTLLVACLLVFGTAVHAKKGGGGGGGGGARDAGLPGELLVQLRSTAALGPLLAKYQLSLVSQFGARPIFRLKVVGLADVNDKIAALERQQREEERQRREEEQRQRQLALENERRRNRSQAYKASARDALKNARFAEALTSVEAARNELAEDPELDELSNAIRSAKEAADAAARTRESFDSRSCARSPGSTTSKIAATNRAMR